MPATASAPSTDPAFPFADANEVLSRLTAEGAINLTGWLQGALMHDRTKGLEQAVIEFARFPRSPERMAAMFYPRKWFSHLG